MPIINTHNDDNKPVDRYEWPARYVTPTPDIYQALRQWRREAVKEREAMLSIGAKEPAAYWMRMQRAITVIVPWFGEPDKGQEIARPSYWPIGLASEMDEVSRKICLEFA